MFRLVIAEDNPIIRKSLEPRYDLNGMGYEIVATFADGSDLIQFLEEGNKVEVIVTDILMCQVSGVEVAKYVFEHKLNCKVIFLSAYQDFSYAKAGIQYNVYDYLIKPVKQAELIELFSKLAQTLLYNETEWKQIYTQKDYEKILSLLEEVTILLKASKLKLWMNLNRNSIMCKEMSNDMYAIIIREMLG